MKFPALFRQARWQAAGLLALGAAVNYGDRAAMSSALPALRDAFHLSNASLGLIGSVFLWSYAISSPVAGHLADRFTRNQIVVQSLACWSLIMALTGFSTGLAVLLLLRVALGFSESLYLPAAIALIGDHHPSQTRARAMNVMIIGISCGVIVGGALAGIFAEHLGWRSVFWILGGAGLVLALVFRRFLPPASVPAFAPKHASPPRVREVLHYLVQVPSYYILLAKAVLAGVAFWIFSTWLPLYFKESFGMSLGMAGFTGNFLPEFSALLGLAAGAWISDYIARYSVRQRMLAEALGYLVAAPCLLLFVGRPSFAIVAVALAAFNFFHGVGDANEASIMCEIIPSRYRSTAIGIQNTCATTAGGCGVFFAGIMKQQLGLNTIFAMTAALVAAAAVLFGLGYAFFVPRDLARAIAASGEAT